jgi:CRISPR-associated endoribonuclease Cas6
MDHSGKGAKPKRTREACESRRSEEYAMRLKVILAPERGILTVPVQYNSLIHGFVYHNMDKALSKWLHEEGHALGERRFKLFTFSRLFGKRKAKDGRVAFDGSTHFYLSSADAEVLGSLAEHLLKKPNVRLGSARCRVEEIAVEPEPEVNGGTIKIKTLSPITTYSTLTTPDGRKKTYFYSPQEDEWSEALVANIGRKAKSLGWEADVDGDLTGTWVKPRRVKAADQKILKFKGTVIKGWTGLYETNLPEPYFRLAYDTGFGSKNPQGFGMVGVVR